MPENIKLQPENGWRPTATLWAPSEQMCKKTGRFYCPSASLKGLAELSWRESRRCKLTCRRLMVQSESVMGAVLTALVYLQTVAFRFKLSNSFKLWVSLHLNFGMFHQTSRRFIHFLSLSQNCFFLWNHQFGRLSLLLTIFFFYCSRVQAAVFYANVHKCGGKGKKNVTERRPWMKPFS